jgi:hypothetical protein
MASVYRRATEERDIPPLDIGVQAGIALAISLRRCRATTYTSSVVPRFTDMLLSPRPFGSRLVVHLGVLYPELRPTLLAILSMRDTAHGFPVTRLLSTQASTHPRSLAHTQSELDLRPVFTTLHLSACPRPGLLPAPVPSRAPAPSFDRLRTGSLSQALPWAFAS